MAVIALPRRTPVPGAAPLPSDHLERVWAWGGAHSVMSWVWRPSTVDGIRDVLALAAARGVSVGLRGAGCSYGDASLNAEEICLDLSRMTRVLDWNPDSGVIRLEPGVTIHQLWRYVLEDGWWPPVVSGTMAITLGGAAAMNVHGKNAWKLGPIGDHVRAIDLLLASGEVVRCSRAERPDLFHAAIGGFGMLGCFTSLELQLERIHSGLLEVEAIPARSLAEALAIFEERLATADYLVGWIDGFARGPALGRGLVHAAYHLPPGADRRAAQTLRPTHQELPPTLFGMLPKSAMWMLMRPLTNDLGVRLVNAVKYHLSARQGRLRYRQPHVAFHFLFDYIPDWKRAYGPGGMIEFQALVPAAAGHAAYTEVLARSHRAGIVPYLSVLKRHRPDPFWMTHGLDGWSLAMHFRVTRANRERLWRHCRALAHIVTATGGRFYYAKDSTLAPEDLGDFYGEERVQRFLTLKREVDPEARWQTELWKRLFAER
jgi:decaprenylphospho-beta-D-ribofuranose 2-oxidase